jgi:hypothetical protein
MELVAPASTQSRNSFAKPDVVAVKPGTATLAGSEVKFTLPAFSVAVVRVNR